MTVTEAVELGIGRLKRPAWAEAHIELYLTRGPVAPGQYGATRTMGYQEFAFAHRIPHPSPPLFPDVLVFPVETMSRAEFARRWPR